MAEFIERFFKKAKPETITFGDLRQFVSERIEENQNLEYKPRGLLVKADDSLLTPMDSRQVVGFSALAKSVAGFANAEGGLLILGVKEKAQKYKGTTVKVRPGLITPLPPTVTREMIEMQLATKIQFPIEGISIFPIRTSVRSNHSVYLIDVPQSIRVPHRVNEQYYYQRYNFDVLEMRHFQIVDMFGKRRRPRLELIPRIVGGSTSSSGNTITSYHGKVILCIQNSGLGIAKFPYLSLRLPSSHRLAQYGIDGNGHEGLPRLAEAGTGMVRFGSGLELVIHPKTQLSVTAIDIEYHPGTDIQDFHLEYELTAEDAEMVKSVLHLSGKQIMDLLTQRRS
jgi:hypothetical protein